MEQIKELNANTNNTHWFKKLFLGLMGSVALTKAVDSYFKDILKFNTEHDILLFWERIASVFSNPDRLAFHLVSILLVIYFLTNIVRYYMSIFIYEHFTNEVWGGSTLIGERYTILNNPTLKTLVDSELEKNEVFKRRKYQKIYTTIFDLVLSLIIFFLLGTAGYSISNINGFAVCMISILLADLAQIAYQKWSYFPKKKKLFEDYKQSLINILNDQTLLNNNGLSIQHFEMAKLLSELNTQHQDNHNTTLKNWIFVDLREIFIWAIIAAIELLLVKSNNNFYWLQLMPLTLLFLSLYWDIKSNKEAWADMFDIEIK